MTRCLLILTLLYLTNPSFGQITPADTAIIKEVLQNTQTCGTFYISDRIDSLLILQIEETLKEKETWLHKQPKSIKIALSRHDKDKILQGLRTSKRNIWTDVTLLENSKIVSWDSKYSLDNYIDSSCLSQLQHDGKSIKVVSFSKPIFLNNGNSLAIYVIEIGIHPKWKKFFYSTVKLMLYQKSKERWTKSGDLYNSFHCNG